MAQQLDTGYFEPAQPALNIGFADLACAALNGDSGADTVEDDGVYDYDEDKDLQDLISLGLHMAD